MVVPVKGQCTVKGCESGDSAGSIATEIQDLLMEVHERLQAIDRRSQEQDTYIRKVQGVDERLNSINESLHQFKDQQDTVVTSLQAVDRRSQEQDIYIRQVQSIIHEFLNTSHQESETQHDVVLNRLETIDRRLSEHDITIKNETRNLWEIAIVGIDFERGPVPPIVDNNWIVVMHRFNGSLNFSRNWIEYKNGFGDIGRGEFWLGNKKIHRLTNRFPYTLRIEVQHNGTGVWYYAEYTTFSIDSENNKYTLRLSGFSGGDAGDSLTDIIIGSNWFHGGMNFTTWDADNDRSSSGNCASSNGGGWWHNACYQACLTCEYTNDFLWRNLRHIVSSDDRGYLRAARMMIRSK